ncbi:uncharacterized protein LOC144467377 [Epinephelus lanceolatus]
MGEHMEKAISVNEKEVHEIYVKEEEDLKEIFLNAEGAPHVQHDYIRLMFRQQRPEGFERPCVAKWLNCSYFSKHAEEDTFNRGLKLLFFAILALAVINIFLSKHLTYWLQYNLHTVPFGLFQVVQGVALLAIFAAFVVVTVHMRRMKKSADLATQRKDQLQKISALVQQLKPT